MLGPEVFNSYRSAGRYAHIAPGRISAAVARGEMPAFRDGKRWVRIFKADLIAWMRSRPVAPSGTKRAETIARRVAQVMGGQK